MANYLDEARLEELWALIKEQDEVAIAAAVAAAPRVEAGSYTGTGDKTNTRTFSFEPLVVIITKKTGGVLTTDSGWSQEQGIVLLRTQSGASLYINGVSKTTATFSENNLEIYSSSSADMAFNRASTVYHYVAIG